MSSESDGQVIGNQYAALRRQIARLQIVVACVAILWVVSTIWLLAKQPTIPSVLTVERLDIVEPDGSLALVLANSERPVAATIGGEVILGDQEEGRRGSPSMIMFDGQGDEVGGLLFGTRRSASGFSAVRQLTLDAYGQDQAVILRHIQDPRGSTSGLVVSARPEHSILDAMKQLGLQPGATGAEMQAAIAALPDESRAARRRELFGVERAFLGAVPTGNTHLTLRDGQGRRRIVIDVPEDGEPSIAILDADGQTVARLPEAPR